MFVFIVSLFLDLNNSRFANINYIYIIHYKFQRQLIMTLTTCYGMGSHLKMTAVCTYV